MFNIFRTYSINKFSSNFEFHQKILKKKKMDIEDYEEDITIEITKDQVIENKQPIIKPKKKGIIIKNDNLKIFHTKKKKNSQNPQQNNNTQKRMPKNILEKIQFAYHSLIGPQKPIEFTFLDSILILVLLSFSFITHFYKIYQPEKVVFDEVYFAKFAQSYLNHNYFFDIHPPLGKLILAGAAYLADFDPNEEFKEIGQEYKYNEYILVRSANAFFATMKIPLLYLAARFCGCSPSWAFVAGFLPAVDNAFITESRVILTDGILHFFSAFAIFSIAYTSSRRSYYVSVILVALSCAFASSTKFTAMGLYFPVAIVFFLNYKFLYTVLAGCIILLVFFIVMLGTFMIHLALLKNPTDDCAFHSNDFCKKLSNMTLFGYYKGVFDLVPTMLLTNLGLNATHQCSSHWYQWPFMAGRATYMYLDPEDQSSQMWCIGTPTVWYMALFGMIIFYVLFFTNRPLCTRNFWLFAGYIASFLPFILIKRVVFNYHYLIPLMFSIVMSSVACEELFGSSWAGALFICLLNFLVFLHFSPLTYSLPIDYAGFIKRMWFKSWMTFDKPSKTE